MIFSLCSLQNCSFQSSFLILPYIYMWYSKRHIREEKKEVKCRTSRMRMNKKDAISRRKKHTDFCPIIVKCVYVCEGKEKEMISNKCSDSVYFNCDSPVEYFFLIALEWKRGPKLTNECK